MRKIIILLTACIAITSCDRPSRENTNQVFARYAPESKEYKDELVSQLRRVEKSKFTYWMDSFETNEESVFMTTHIQGDGLWANMVLLLKDSKNGIEDIVERNGMGYQGAELKDLKYDIIQSSIDTEFVFQEVSAVVD